MKYRQVFRVLEREKTNLPIEALLFNGKLEIFQESQERGYFNFSLKGNEILLTAGNHVGLIPINEKVALFVEPKIAKSTWLYLVEKANGRLKRIDRLRTYNSQKNIQPSLFEFLIDVLVTQLNLIEKEGLIAEYRSTNTLTSFPKGRINFKQTINQAWTQGKKQSVVVDYYVFSHDTPHNRLLRYALFLALEFSLSLPNSSLQTLESIEKYIQMFSNIPLDRSLRYLGSVTDIIKANALPFTRQYYKLALTTASIIVGSIGIDPNAEGWIDNLAFVVNMETVFEKYCQIILKEDGDSLGQNIQVKNQEEGKIPLFSGEKADKRHAEPDIVIEFPKDKGADYLIIEVKYKFHPSREDINQAVTYAVAYKTKRVILLCVAETKNDEGLSHLGFVNDIGVGVYKMFLEDIELAEAKLLKTISDMLHDKT